MNSPRIEGPPASYGWPNLNSMTPDFVHVHFPGATARELRQVVIAWKQPGYSAIGRARFTSAIAMRWPRPEFVEPAPPQDHRYLPRYIDRVHADSVEAMLTAADPLSSCHDPRAEAVADVAAEAFVSLEFAAPGTTRSLRFLSERGDAPLTWLRLAYVLGCCSLNGQLNPAAALRGIFAIAENYAAWRIDRPGLQEGIWPRIENIYGSPVSVALILNAVLIAQPNLAIVPVERRPMRSGG